jgi:hypothetical protein
VVRHAVWTAERSPGVHAWGPRTRDRPGGAAERSRRASRGGSGETDPPLVDLWAVACNSTCSHRPSRRAARRAMSRCRGESRSPGTDPSPPGPAVPVTRAAVRRRRGTVARASWGDPDHGPVPRRPSPRSPEGPDRLAATARSPGRLRKVPVADGCPSTRSDPTPSQLPARDADSSSPRSPGARSEVAGGSVSAPDPSGTEISKDGASPQVKSNF